MTALMHASRTCHNEVVKCLVREGGADPEARGPGGRTALMMAAAESSAPDGWMIQALVEGGAQLEARDEAQWTALAHASAAGNVTSVRALLALGAEVEAADGEGRRPLMLAGEAGHAAVAVCLMEEGKAKVNARDHHGRSAMAYAQANGHTDAYLVLVRC
jgi:uncharacterized protein